MSEGYSKSEVNERGRIFIKKKKKKLYIKKVSNKMDYAEFF